jgi:hypothetical protein
MTTSARVLPYALSWIVLAVLMVVGMQRLPPALYTPIDGEWAKWNAEAILKFGRPFDLSPYSMLAGMGSTYFPNLPYYAAELAFSIVLLARVIGFSWLITTVGAQLYLYVLFPPFSEVFLTYTGNSFSLAPYYAHLIAVLNAALGAFLMCGRSRDWRHNLVLAACVLALFISGLLSAPFTFIFFMPPYLVIGAALIVTRRPSAVEWSWKGAALAAGLIFFFASGLLDYYRGTIATASRTPPTAFAWDKLWETLLSTDTWLHIVRDYPPCAYSRQLLCMNDRGSWLLIAAIAGAAVAIVTQRGDIRVAAWALIAYLGLAISMALSTAGSGP